MATKIGSFFWEIFIDSAKFKQGLGEAKKMMGGLKDAARDAGEMAGKISTGLVGVGYAFKKAMDFGAAGAKLDYARGKFDRLSESIGTTGDLLLGDLREATRGMRTDADLVASAGDLMALGLAKTSDEAVRLTRVAGALNMDMNQLVLTLANQTTMRFDQLGVSVDGFDEKVRKLEESGMSASDAFGEAFLQQAEEQVRKVGEAADSGVAAFQRFDVATQSLADAAKMKLYPALATAAEAATHLLTVDQKLADVFNQHNKNVLESSETYQDYINEMVRAARAAGLHVRIKDGEVQVLSRVNGYLKDVSDQYNFMSEAAFDGAKASEDFRDVGATVPPVVQSIASAADDAASSIREQAQSMRSDLVDAVKSVQNAEQDWMEGAGGDIASALREAGVSGDKYKEALGIIDQEMGTTLLSQEEYNEAVKELSEKFDSGKMSRDEFRQSIKDLTSEYMPLNEQVQEANNQLWLLQLKWQWFQANNKLDLEVNIDQNGNLPNTGGGGSTPGPNAGGGGPGTGADGEAIGLAGGGSFTIPPGYPNDSYPLGMGIFAQSGETVTVTPAGKSAAPTINIYVTGAGNPDAVATAIVRKARQQLAAGAWVTGG